MLPLDNSLRPLCSALRALCVKSLSFPLRTSAPSAPSAPSASLGYLFPRLFFTSLLLCLITSLSGCNRGTHDPSSLTFLIESNPANLDPRYATDAQSQRIDGLLFSSLLERDEQMNLHGDLAETWELPDPLTYVFHLRSGVHFHDGRPVTSADVKATFDHILNPANHSPKRALARPTHATAPARS